MIKHKLTYLGLLAIFWLVMRLYLFRATAILFYMLLVFLPLIFLLFRISARGTKVNLEVPVQVVKKGEMFCVRICVQGRNHLPNGPVVVWLWHRNCVSEKWKKKKLTFYGEMEESYELYTSSKYCAQYLFFIKKAKIYDIFQIFSKKIPILEKEYAQQGITVLPECYTLAEWPVRPNPNVMVEGERYSNVKSGDDASEIFDIRDYVPGDRLNRIHWKLTGKLRRLMVKEFGLPIDSSVLIFFDLGFYKNTEEYMEYRDALFCVLFSLSETLSAQGQVHYIAWNAQNGENQKHKITCPEDFYETMGIVLRERADRENVNRAARYLAEYERDQYTNIFYLSADKEPWRGLSAMEEARKSAWLTGLLFCGREAMKEREQSFAPDVEFLYFDTKALEEELNTSLFEGGSLRWQEN